MEEELLFHLSYLNLCRVYKKWKKRRRARRWSICPKNRDRNSKGFFQNEFIEMKEQNEEKFFLHTRMTRNVYDLLLGLMESHLEKPRQMISAEERLSLTVLHLANGVSFNRLAVSYKMGKTTVRNIVLETCEMLWKILSPKYLSEPTTSEYEDIANDFREMWEMPNCVGVIDGKHIAISSPKNSGSTFLNYKSFHSIILMATCDAKYSFTTAYIGRYGSHGDGDYFQHSSFGRMLLANELPLPPSAPLGNDSTEQFQHYFVGDVSFPLKLNLMRPYSGSGLTQIQDVFNYRLSRVRRVCENSFGVLTARWRILRTAIECSPENCEKIVLACVVLHNFIMVNDLERWYCPDKYVDWEDSCYNVHHGYWRNDVAKDGGPQYSIQSFKRNASIAAFQQRDTLAQFFIYEGAVSFQFKQ